MFRKLLAAYIVVNFVIVNSGMHKSICLHFNFIASMVTKKAVFCDFENDLKLFPALFGIEHCFSEMWP